MAATLVAPQAGGLSEVLDFGGHDSTIDASMVDIEGKGLELETTDNDRVASPTGEKFVSNASPPLSADSDNAKLEPLIEVEAPLGQVGSPDVVETDQEVITKDIPLGNERNEEVATCGAQDVLIDVSSKESDAVASPAIVAPLALPETDLLAQSPLSDDTAELESLVPADPTSASLDVQASSPIDQSLPSAFAPAVPSVIPEDVTVEHIDALVKDIPVPVHVDEKTTPAAVVDDGTPTFTPDEELVSLEEVHELPKELDASTEQAILEQDALTTEAVIPVPEEGISLSAHDSSVEEAEVPVTVVESPEAAVEPLLQLQEIMPVAQAAVEPVESMEDATNDSLVESEENFASSQDVISPQVDGTQGSPDEGVALQDPEKVDNEPAVEVTPEDDMAVSRDLQNSVGEEESLLESGTEATPGPEGSQAVGNDSEVVVPEASSVVQEAEPVDELVSVENAPESVVAEAPPVEVAEESLVESADQEVTANGPELDSTQAEVVDEFPLVMEEAEPTDNLSAADSASEAVVPPGVALEEDLAETPAESTTLIDHEVTEVEPQVDTVEANAVENESVDLAVEAPFVIENEEPAVVESAPQSVEDDVEPTTDESLADTPVVVDNLAESTLPDQEVLTVLDNYAEAGVEQTQVLEETSDVAEAPLVVEDAESTDNVSGVPEPLVEETPLESTIDESLVDTPAQSEPGEISLPIKDNDVELNAEEIPALPVIQTSESLVTAENASPQVEALALEQVPDQLEPSNEEVIDIVQPSTVFDGPEPIFESAVVDEHIAPVEDLTPEIFKELAPSINESGVDTSVIDTISPEVISDVQESSLQEDPALVAAREAEVADQIPTSNLEAADEGTVIEDTSEHSVPTVDSTGPVELLSERQSHALVEDTEQASTTFEDQALTSSEDAVVLPTTNDETVPLTEDSADVEEAVSTLLADNAAQSTEEVYAVTEDVATASIPPAESPSEALGGAGILEDDIPTKPSITEVDVVLSDESFQTSGDSPTSAEAEQALLTPASQIERPTSPWTPSYSVTSQGPGLTAEEDISDTEIDDAKDLKDIPVVSVTPGEESGDILSDQPLVSEVERPKSPWTPSYSVSVQGSPMQPTAELESSEITENVDDVSRLADSEALLTADVFVTQQDIAPLDIVNAAVETFEASNDVAQLESTEDSQPQPLQSLEANESVDVSQPEIDLEIKDVLPQTLDDTVQPERIEDSHVVDPPPATQNADEPTYVDGAEGEINETPSVELNTSDLVEPEESTATSEIPAVGAMEEELNAIGATETSTNDDINAPASLDKPEFLEAPQVERPWTPSYSVTQQGPGTPEPSSESAVENGSVELADPNAIEDMRNDFIEPFAPKAIHASTSGINESQLLNAGQETTKEIERPWTPSYSVLQQGPGTPLVEKPDLLEPIIVADHADVKSSTPEHSPVPTSSPSLWTPSYSVTSQGTPSPKPHTLEVESDDKLEPLPSSSAPFPVDDDAHSVATSLDTINDAPTSRARLESTTSSRFFPGGWFARPQAEGRTSTDNAQGVFIPPKSQTETQPTSTDDPAPITTDSEEISSDDSDEEDEDEAKAKKGRWCVVM